MSKLLDFRKQAHESSVTPTKKTLVYFTALWLVGVGCIVIANTDYFAQSYSLRKSPVINIFIFLVTVHVLRMYVKFYKRKK